MLRNKRVKSSEKLSLLQRLGLHFYEKKEKTVLYWIAIVVFGIFSYTTLLPRQGFPSVNVPVSVMSGTYFVNDQQQVDSEVVRPIVDTVSKLEFVRETNAQANNNFFFITFEFADSYTSEEGSALVEQSVGQLSLPAEASFQFQAIDASKFEEKSDLLLAVFPKDPNKQVDFASVASDAAKNIEGSDAVAAASYIKQQESGLNPVTGETVTQTTAYDRVGLKDGIGQILFYPSAIIGVRAEADADAFAIYDGVMEKVTELRADPAYADVDFAVVADYAEGIEEQVSSLQRSLLEGLIVVMVVSFILISWRAGIATALSMTTVLLATIGILYATGNTLNTITLFALILSLGLIVDDTTIMVEAIDASRGVKKSRREIVAQAIRKVARASFAGTLTTMFGFAPMLFIGGILGDFIRVLPITIILSLAMSLLISLTLVPFFARMLLSGKESDNSFVHRLENAVAGSLSRLVRATSRSKKRRLITSAVALGISGTFIVASVLLFSTLKFDIFPKTKDTNALSVTVSMPPTARLEDSERATDRALTIIGDTLGSNFKDASLQGSGSDGGSTIFVDLIPYQDREVTSVQLEGTLTDAFKDFDGAEIRVSQVDVGPPKEAYPFQVRIYGDDQQKTAVLAQDIVSFLRGREIERPNGTKSTITNADWVSDGIRRSAGDQEQSRPYALLRASFADDDTSALVTAAQSAVETAFTPEKIKEYGLNSTDVVYDFGNESDNQESFSTMLIAFPVLLIAMYVLLAVQFRSLLQPLLIFSAIPYSFFGVALGLTLTNNPLSFFVMIGFFALIGIAVNNTILLTDYANQAKLQGESPTSAIATALQARFRPLVTTSLTSVVALIPLAISDPFWESLAVTLIFGLISSTLLVLISFPYVYLIGEWLRIRTKRLVKRNA